MPPNPPPNRPPAGRQQPSGSESSSATPGPSGMGGTGRGGSASGRGRPVQRLQSLKKRTPGGSLVPLNADGSTPKPTLKFQPKVVTRKSKEEREALENLEAQRLRERISAANAARRTTRGGDRGRGRGRGRGGASGASGPLGEGAGHGRHGGAWKGKGGRSGKISGFYGVKNEGGADGEQIGGDISSDEGSDYGLRFSIDHINLESDSEVEALGSGGIGKGKTAMGKSTPTGGNRGLRPVRVERHEHVERSIGLPTEASTSVSKSAELRKKAKEKAGAADDSLFVEDDQSDDSDAEGGDDEVVMRDIKESDPTKDGPQIKAEPTDDDAIIDDSIPPAASEEVVPKPRIKPKKAKDPRKKLQTEEERQEYDRYEEDIDYLRSTLGTLPTTAGNAPDTSVTAEVEKKDEADAETDAKPTTDERQGQLFLLQFPPMTPNLVPPTREKESAAGQGEEAVAESAAAPAPAAQGSVAIKEEEGAANPASTASTAPPLVTATNSTLPRGRVGKLNIHRSGKATIDWGGVNFELTKGSTVGFIQDAVILSDNMAGSADGGASTRDKKLWAMSQVTGKFVVTPDWDKILDE
ncbi:hypothetical protein MGYG_07808 [Nannizzia gypsea CBS 118893]|uniref:DNA-directed RNA polymerase III RPC4 n=1 Tax=Arthroderma gypseum (strain ATCC MYA-4604 / CBS 118893) TaxID=535722 RepID=E4V477_ARTGP|nr:hypothetical protein MGYG_07808 [Nannizzia gypsea CBS 118893]EFR04801.1 hypothetical protein MGYG_07808 [Nannizzia gypsea CBS 118893]